MPSDTEQIGLRLSKVVVDKIDALIEKGFAKTRADFCDKAVIEYLRNLGLITIDDLGITKEELLKMREDYKKLENTLNLLKEEIKTISGQI